MECRCYHGGEGRTALRVLRYKAADYGRIVVIYITVNNGIILPKAAIGSQYEEFVKLVRAHLPGRLK